MLQPQVRASDVLNIAAAGTYLSAVMERFDGLLALAAKIKFNYGSGGTSVAIYLQTSLDFGLTWQDVARFDFTTASAVKDRNFSKLTPQTSDKTPGDAALGAGLSVDGILGDRFRWKAVVVGTYAGTTAQGFLAPS